MADVINVNDNNFEKVVVQSEPCSGRFWAPWCGPCRMVGPIVRWPRTIKAACKWPN